MLTKSEADQYLQQFRELAAVASNSARVLQRLAEVKKLPPGPRGLPGASWTVTVFTDPAAFAAAADPASHELLVLIDAET